MNVLNDSVCRLCNQEFKSAIALKNHVVKSDDAKHKLLAFAYSNLHLKCKELSSFVEQYKTWFDKVTDDNLMQLQEKLVNSIKEKIQEEKTEREIKKRQEKEQLRLQRHYEDMRRLAELEEKHSIEQRLMEDFFKDLDKQYRPKALLNSFYRMINSKCISYAVELTLLKQLYTKYKLEPKQAEFIIKYMAKMGYSNLRSVNYVIQEALECSKYMKQLKEENTIPFLVKYYYTQMGMKLNFKLFLKESRKIHSSMIANDLTIQQVKNVIDGMIQKKVDVLLWFDSYVSRFANKKDDPIHNYTKDRAIKENINEIIQGRITLDDVSDDIRDHCFVVLRNKYMNGDFDKSYNYFEWSFKTKLPLDEEMYLYGKEHNSERKNRFEDWHIQIIKSGSESMLASYENTIKNYKIWLSSFEKTV